MNVDQFLLRDSNVFLVEYMVLVCFNIDEGHAPNPRVVSLGSIFSGWIFLMMLSTV